MVDAPVDCHVQIADYYRMVLAYTEQQLFEEIQRNYWHGKHYAHAYLVDFLGRLRVCERVAIERGWPDVYLRAVEEVRRPQFTPHERRIAQLHAIIAQQSQYIQSLDQYVAELKKELDNRMEV